MKTVPRAEDKPAPQPNPWLGIFLGIAIAGALYPFVLLIAGYLIGVVFGLGLFTNLGMWTEFFSLVNAMMASGMTIRPLFVAVIVALVVSLVLRTLRIRTNHVMKGALVGGLAGLATSVPFVIALRIGGNWDAVSVLVATVMGQIGGAWGAWLMLRRVQVIEPPMPWAELKKRFQFRISHLLWINFWLALLLTAMKLAGLLNPNFVSFLGIWLVLQTASLVVIWLVERKVRLRASMKAETNM